MAIDLRDHPLRSPPARIGENLPSVNLESFAAPQTSKDLLEDPLASARAASQVELAAEFLCKTGYKGLNLVVLNKADPSDVDAQLADLRGLMTATAIANTRGGEFYTTPRATVPGLFMSASHVRTASGEHAIQTIAEDLTSPEGIPTLGPSALRPLPEDERGPSIVILSAGPDAPGQALRAQAVASYRPRRFSYSHATRTGDVLVYAILYELDVATVEACIPGLLTGRHGARYLRLVNREIARLHPEIESAPANAPENETPE